MCMVAAGELDGHFTYGVHIWDIAAGDLIVREAGGVVIDTSGLYLIVREAGGFVTEISGQFENISLGIPTASIPRTIADFSQPLISF